MTPILTQPVEKTRNELSKLDWVGPRVSVRRNHRRRAAKTIRGTRNGHGPARTRSRTSRMMDAPADNLPGDNLEHVRDILAVAAAAVQAPFEGQWTGLTPGLLRLLETADDLLVFEIGRMAKEGPQ